MGEIMSCLRGIFIPYIFFDLKDREQKWEQLSESIANNFITHAYSADMVQSRRRSQPGDRA